MASLIAMWVIALALGYFVMRRGREVSSKALRSSVDQLIAIMPQVCLAVIAAGFISKLMPADVIGHMIGWDSGIGGIMIATLAGAMLPSGPMVSFPLIVIMKNSGAGMPQILAFLTAWSVFGFHRVMSYEVTLMGWHFTTIRIGSSTALPFIAAGITYGICMVTGIR